MSPLDDDELNSMLEQAKSKPPEASPRLAARALRAYQANLGRPASRRRVLLRPVLIPLPLAIAAAVLLILVGALGGRIFRANSMTEQSRNLEVPVTREHIAYRDCSASGQEASPPEAPLTFKEFRPVSRIRPRAVAP